MSLKLLRFGAIWCPPCNALKPIWEKIVGEYNDVEFEAVDIDESPKLATLYRIMSVPTIVFLKDGKVIDSMVGLQTEAEIKERIERYK